LKRTFTFTGQKRSDRKCIIQSFFLLLCTNINMAFDKSLAYNLLLQNPDGSFPRPASLKPQYDWYTFTAINEESRQRLFFSEKPFGMPRTQFDHLFSFCDNIWASASGRKVTDSTKPIYRYFSCSHTANASGPAPQGNSSEPNKDSSQNEPLYMDEPEETSKRKRKSPICLSCLSDQG
jgi:hypothetical protein